MPVAVAPSSEFEPSANAGSAQKNNMFSRRVKQNDADFELKPPPVSSLDLGGSKVKVSGKDMGFVADDGKNLQSNGFNKGR